MWRRLDLTRGHDRFVETNEWKGGSPFGFPLCPLLQGGRLKTKRSNTIGGVGKVQLRNPERTENRERLAEGMTDTQSDIKTAVTEGDTSKGRKQTNNLRTP